MTENQENTTENTERKVESQPVEKNEEVINPNEDSSPEIKSEQNKKNWANFREERELERKKRYEAEQLAFQKNQEAEALRAAMEAMVNRNAQTSVQDSYNDQTEEDRISKLIEDAIRKEKVKLADEEKKRSIEELPIKLRKEYKDFDQVCSQENLDYLDYHHPKISQAFSNLPNSMEKWSGVYEAMKKLVPYGNKKSDEAQIERNLKKPQASVPALTDTKPKGSPWMLSEERKQANWERMQRDRKSFSS